MSHPNLPSDCTSADFEKEAMQRLRTLVSFLPTDCKIFREPWDCSTVVCLDFLHCPHQLDRIRERSQELIDTTQELGLANAIIFRIGNKFMGWKAIARPKSGY